MAEHWIDARDAARIVGDTDLLIERLAAGMVRHRAEWVTIDGEQLDAFGLPENFWSSDGRERLQQHWEVGDFLSSYDGLTQARAIGVKFQASDVLDIVPFDQRAAAARCLSVAGNPAWVSAREARRFAYEQAGLYPLTAGKAVIAQCRLGFISGRAVEMRWARGQDPDKWKVEAREWDIPVWFWADFTTENASTQDWENGLFAGQGSVPKGYASITLEGVHFLRSSLDVLLPHAPAHLGGVDAIDAKKPALPDAQLGRWWAKMAPTREALSQTHLWVLAAHDHPQHSVSRERIRVLADGRKPGPKTS